MRSSTLSLRSPAIVRLDPDVKLDVVTPARTRPPHLVGRELACLLPAHAYLTLSRALKR